jgi:ectoine hydroxylase-related dioxygenase (phytanoyl-CoA dioxygenase family)
VALHNKFTIGGKIMYMTHEEQYLFDLRGYMVLPGVLSETEVEEINQVIDRVLPNWGKASNEKHIAAGLHQDIVDSLNMITGDGHVGFSSGLMLDWGEPIRRLVGHKKVLPYLIDIIGPTLRLDHQFAVLMKAGPSADPLHGGNTPHSEGEYYHFRNNRVYCGLTVVSFALMDAPPGAGGLCVVPGSHKSDLPLPRQYEYLTTHPDFVKQLPLRKGDVVIFTEALTHGVLPWTRPYERRTLIFKHSPGFIQWEKGSPFASLDYDWEEHQRYLLSPPYREDRTKIPWPPRDSASQA